jgi:hypothetical protein
MHSESKTFYDPKEDLNTAPTDPQFQKPYTDIDEWRSRDTGCPVRYRYIHGGFEGTETRFSFCFPAKEDYKGRFFHFMAPMQGSENSSEGSGEANPLTAAGRGVEDKIAFAVRCGAYFVETNMGVGAIFGPLPDPTIIYRSSAAAAEYSRQVAARLYGPHRPFGYIYGGSGGGFKSTSCFENACAWDGAAPYVIGSPMAIPNCHTVRAHARRVLRHKLPQIADATEPGGSGNIYAGLNDEEKAALEEATKMGFPPRSWFIYKDMDDGALPVLAPGIRGIDPAYFEDFWKVPGYLGADPRGSAARDRIQHKTVVRQVYVPAKETAGAEQNAGVSDGVDNGVDNAWKKTGDAAGLVSRPWIELETAPGGDPYLFGAYLIPLSGEAAQYRFPLEGLEGNTAIIGSGFGLANMIETLSQVKPGDGIIIDNSEYIAIQTYHRHQVPDKSFAVWDQFRDANGEPRYPQRPALTGPLMARGGAGSLQSGSFRGKMIVTAAMLDYDALPWQPDWYRQRVREALGGDESGQFRLYYIDHAIHGDSGKTLDDLHTVSYLGALHQALLDLSDWVERGIAPPEGTVYAVNDGQLSVPETARERRGIQPVLSLLVNGRECAEIAVGEEARFSGFAELPPGAGKLTHAEWSFEGEENFPVAGQFSEMSADGAKAAVHAVHVYQKPGTYFAVLRVSSNRRGDGADVFTQVKNLRRARVIVK